MKNMRLSLVFTIQAVLILIGIATISVSAINTLTDVDEEYYAVFYANDDIATAGLSMSSSATALRLACSNLVSDNVLNDEQYTNFLLYTEDVQDSIDLSKTLVQNSTLSETGKAEVLETLQETEDYRTSQVTLVNQYVTDLKNGKELDSEVFYEIGIKGAAIFGCIDTVNAQTTRLFGEMIEEIKEQVIISDVILLVISLLVIMTTVIIMIIISRNITSSLGKLKQNAIQLAQGELDIDIAMDGKNEVSELSKEMSRMARRILSIIDDISTMSSELDKGNLRNYKINADNYKGKFKTVVDGVNHTVESLLDENYDIICAMQSFSDGNFDIKITELPGDKFAATQALRTVRASLTNFTDNILNIVEQIKMGNLNETLDTGSMVGDWLTMCNGLSDILLCVKEPLDDMQEIFEEFAQGNFKHKSNKEYMGVFGDIQSVANSTSETINLYIDEISFILNEIANKNFDVEMKQKYVGDFVKIENSIDFIINNLNMLLRNIITTSEQVNIGIKQVTDTSTDLAQGSTEQAATVDLLVNNFESLNGQANENQTNSNEASQLAIETKATASDGAKQMHTMLEAMDGINKASQSIAGIINVIDDIAFQTNLLALNAAVEAARAGSHGKGFAVVADEVRTLAGRSKQAAMETTELIETTISKVEEGSKMANITSESLNKIVTEIEDVTLIIEKITELSIKQGESIDEMTSEISGISEVTVRNTASSEELASSSEEISAQADIMLQTVNEFNLKNR